MKSTLFLAFVSTSVISAIEIYIDRSLKKSKPKSPKAVKHETQNVETQKVKTENQFDLTLSLVETEIFDLANCDSYEKTW